MTDEELVNLQQAYGSDWTVRIPPHEKPTATRHRSLSREELGAGLAMTLVEDRQGYPRCRSLADQLADQQRIENELIEAALAEGDPPPAQAS